MVGLVIPVIIFFVSHLFGQHRKESEKQQSIPETATQPSFSREKLANRYIEPTRSAVLPKTLSELVVERSGTPIGGRFKDSDEWLKMVAIPSGTFLMGSKPSVFSHRSEQPQHRVTVSGFVMSKFAVTQEQWFAVMGTNPSHIKGNDRPVEWVSWADVKQFLKTLNAKTGKAYRLPSEAEWEYAARAGSQADYGFGDDQDQLGQYAWFWDNSNVGTHPVGKKLPNAFGLYDMHGNVNEWTEDYHNDSYDGAPSDGSAWIAGDRSSHVIRGGCWGDDPPYLRSARRTFCRADYKFNSLGFRVVRTHEVTPQIREKSDRAIHGRVSLLAEGDSTSNHTLETPEKSVRAILGMSPLAKVEKVAKLALSNSNSNSNSKEIICPRCNEAFKKEIRSGSDMEIIRCPVCNQAIIP